MNNKLTIAKISVPLPIDKQFDYSVPKLLLGRLKIGMRVNVEFNKKNITGFVTGFSSASKIKRLNPIKEAIDNFPFFSDANLQLAKMIKDYYVCSLGEALEAMIPYKLRNTKIILNNLNLVSDSIERNKKNKIFYIQGHSKDIVLDNFKKEIIKKIKNKNRIIYLVPETRMITPVSDYFAKILNIKIGLWHSKLSKKKMLDLWMDISNDNIDLIIGTRSCIFAPIRNLGLIIIQNEDNSSYKEDQVPYYHVLKIAQMRQDIEKCDIILSSTMPSSYVYYLILNKKIYVKRTIEYKTRTESYFLGINYRDRINKFLENELESSLEKKDKILIFLNRKGFATFIYCIKCKEVIKCNRCSSNLRFDYSKKKLICSYCNQEKEFLEICPKCNSSYVKFGGLGIEKLESNLQKIFPSAKIITIEELFRMGTDLTNYDIVIATKKILNFNNFHPDLTIIWNLDSLLNIGDFYSAEETYNLLAKLLHITAKKMIICTSINKDFYLFKSLKNLNFKKFYKKELDSRKSLLLPPYYHMGLISIRGLDKNKVADVASKIYSVLKKRYLRNLKISNPYLTLRSRLREKYYKYILIKSKNVKLLNKILKEIIREFRSNRMLITVNIDPI